MWSCGIGGEEDGVTSMGEVADPDECELIADLGVDFPFGIGNIHSVSLMFKRLNFDTLQAIQDKVGKLPPSLTWWFWYSKNKS